MQFVSSSMSVTDQIQIKVPALPRHPPPVIFSKNTIYSKYGKGENNLEYLTVKNLNVLSMQEELFI